MKICPDCKDNHQYGWGVEEDMEGKLVPSCKECGWLDLNNMEECNTCEDSFGGKGVCPECYRWDSCYYGLCGMLEVRTKDMDEMEKINFIVETVESFKEDIIETLNNK